MKFLIDECLSPRLVDLARAYGHGESSHIVWLGEQGIKDWDLIPLISAGDWTFVTQNAVDFRGDAARPGEKGQYTRLDLHAGLICLNADMTMTRDMQLELFGIALDELVAEPDLVNKVLEVSLGSNEIRLVRYDLPS